MKILYIHSLYYPYVVGGAEISLQILVESMKLKGHEVVVLTTSDQDGLQKDYINDIPVYRAKIENIYWPYKKESRSSFQKVKWHFNDRNNLEMMKYVKEVLDKEKPDLVSCHNLSGFSISVWNTTVEYNIPIIQVLHDFYFLCINSNMYKNGVQCAKRCYQCKLMRVQHKKKSKHINAVVGISQYILDKVTSEGYFSDSIQKVIYNARIIPLIQKVTSIEKNGKLRFGFIGTLTENKGIEWLIQEFKTTDSTSTSLLIAGKGEEAYVEKLKREAEKDVRIIFLGYVDSQSFYSMIDVLVVPSLWEEPLGMVAIEACANDIPVITTGEGGLKEIIKHEYNGLLCNANDPYSLSKAIIRLNIDRTLLDKLVNNTKQSVQSFTDSQRLSSEYELLYQSVLNSIKQNDHY